MTYDRSSRSDDLRKPVDVLPRPALCDRDQQTVLVLRVVVLEPVARVDAFGPRPLANSVEVGQPDGELAHHGPRVDQLGAEGLARVCGAAQHQLADLDDAAVAEPGQVDHPGEGVERLRRADVARGLFAPDVLLAR